MTKHYFTPGEKNALTDVPGLRLGHAHDDAIKTGVSLLVGDKPFVAGVDVRGGGPGTRETDALEATCLVERVHGLVLSGGSVFGLASADRLAWRLSEDGIGLALGPRFVPVVPSAILFDLKNGGDKSWAENPYPKLADAAYDALKANGAHEAGCGLIGAGRGATAGAEAGGLGTASFTDTATGLVVSAMVAVNSFGNRTPEAGGAPIVPGEIDLPKLGLIAGNTTIAIVATNLTLDKAGAKRLAMMAQDGLARTLRPIHTPFDGDTVFAVSTEGLSIEGAGLGVAASTMAVVGSLAADALAVAVGRAFER